VNPKLRTISERRGGWFCRQDALAAGYSDQQIRQRMRRDEWFRLCRDVYVDQTRFRSQSSGEHSEPSLQRERRLHVLKAKAVQHRAGADFLISHQSAVVQHGLPSWGLDLSRVHLTKPGARAPGAIGRRACMDRPCRNAMRLGSTVSR
jgi:Transcriptional regulator, AbiEi antitoxin